MASNDWQVIYQSYTVEELAAELARLKTESQNLYLSQSVGSKSYSRSITDVRQRLSACVEVMNARAGIYDESDTLADFS